MVILSSVASLAAALGTLLAGASLALAPAAQSGSYRAPAKSVSAAPQLVWYRA